MENVQVGRLLPLPPSEQSTDFGRLGDSGAGREPLPARRPRSIGPRHDRARGQEPDRVAQPRPETRAGSYFRPLLEPIRTVSFLRPRRRRRLSVLRPPFDFIRARKPCLFFRFRFRGLYVGFMRTTPPTSGTRDSFPVEHAKIFVSARERQDLAALFRFPGDLPSYVGRIDFSTPRRYVRWPLIRRLVPHLRRSAGEPLAAPRSTSQHPP